MNFAYLDSRSLLETILAPGLHSREETIPAVPVELDQRWHEFEKELGNFKMEFTRARAAHTKLNAKYAEKKEESNVIRMVLDNVTSQGLKEKLSSIVDNYEQEEGVDALAQQCGEAAGKVEAMKRVLMDTNPDRYGKFTCFVCMDKLVDAFIDPCGHVICDGCWLRTRDKDRCPGCRTLVNGVRKIYNM
jgi:hypothetical protein